MNKLNMIVLILTVAILTVFTFFVTVKHPSIHKQVLITDANYTFVEEDIGAAMPVKIEPQNQGTQQTPQIIQMQNKAESQSSPRINNNRQPQKQQKKPVIKKQPSNKPIEKKVQKPQKKKTSVNKIQTVKKTPVNKPVVPKTFVKEVQKSTPQKVVKQKPITPVQQEVLTEREEIIAWNNWRSALQNQVMSDTKIGAPMGTQFQFSFTVDKFGNMSNVKVWSQNPVYTDLGVMVIKPILMSYQNKPILDFPRGTKRIITNVTGGFYISTMTKYSSSNDYSDYEKVKRAN